MNLLTAFDDIIREVGTRKMFKEKPEGKYLDMKWSGFVAAERSSEDDDISCIEERGK